jgi:hypothetical protein
MQDQPDRLRAYLGQPVWSLAQGTLQGRQRPRLGPILLRVWHTAHLGQDPFLFCAPVPEGRTTTVSWLNGRDTFLVEAADQLGDGLSGLPTACPRGLCIGLPSRHGQDDLAAGHVARWLAVGMADLLQHILFFIG